MGAHHDRKLTVGSLFSGIGGFELGLESTGGFEVEFQIEIDPFCQQVLAKHWPNVARYGDIRECGIGRKHELARVDVLCGGFPCQPHSLAGKRKASEDERDLWGEFYRLIRELEPRWVVAENVLGLLSSENGAFFGRVLRDLAQAGYDAEWRVLRASDIGAPHRRERVFIMAYTSSQGLPSIGQTRFTTASTQARAGMEPKPERCSNTMAHASSEGSQTSRTWKQTTSPQQCSASADVADTAGGREWFNRGAGKESRAQSLTEQSSTWLAQSILGRDAYGLPSRLDRYQWPAGPGEEQYSWEPARTTTERLPNRSRRLKALGNAIVPQLVALIGKAIVEHENERGVA